MTERFEASQGAGKRGEPVRRNLHDMQIDKETGLPVDIVPDGEKADTKPEVPEDERLRVDPDSCIPRPVQPDLA